MEKNLSLEMHELVRVMVVLENNKIAEMKIIDQRGAQIGRLEASKLYDSIQRNKSGQCVIHAGENGKDLVYADVHCDLLKLEALMWKKNL